MIFISAMEFSLRAYCVPGGGNKRCQWRDILAQILSSRHSWGNQKNTNDRLYSFCSTVVGLQSFSLNASGVASRLTMDSVASSRQENSAIFWGWSLGGGGEEGCQ